MGTIYVQPDPVDGTFTAHVLELPGCNARGGSRDEAVARVKQSFRDYLALLAARGMSVDHWKELDVDAFDVKDPPARGVFPEDFRQMDEHEMRDFLRQLEVSRSALLAELRGLSAEQLEKQPTPSTWSVREALEHIMETSSRPSRRSTAWRSSASRSWIQWTPRSTTPSRDAAGAHAR